MKDIDKKTCPKLIIQALEQPLLRLPDSSELTLGNLSSNWEMYRMKEHVIWNYLIPYHHSI